MQLSCPNCKSEVDVDPASTGDVHCPSCGSNFPVDRDATADWKRGGLPHRFGKFELLNTVGHGSFGVVFKARDTELERIVAVKVPHAGVAGSGSGGDRFLREGRSAGQLRHTGIVPIYEVGQHEGTPYLVSEFVQGITLADLLTGERLPHRQAAELIAAVADALQYAHEHGVIHRDVKPSNIMLETGTRDQGSSVRERERGDRSAVSSPEAKPLTPRLTDFGLAKRDAAESTVTMEGAVLGTPSYMSPEQAAGEGHAVDGRTDIYSLGVVLYQLLTGVPPFKGNRQMLLHQVLTEEPRPPRKLDATVPRDLETICLKAMAKEPKRRYAAAGELADDLRRFLRGEPIRARPASRWERASKWVRRRPAAAALVAVLVLVAAAAAGTGYWLWQRAEDQRREDEARRRAADEAKRVKVEWYSTFIKRWGVPEGIGPVTEEQSRRRYLTFRFHKRDGKVEKVEALNGHGGLTDRHEVDPVLGDQSINTNAARECFWEYQRNERGELTKEVARNRSGGIVWTFHYTTGTTGHFTDERGFPRTRAGSGAAYVEFVFSEQGLEKERRYLDRLGRPRPDANRVFGKRMEHDERGLVVAETNFGVKGQPMPLRGYAKEVRAYNSQGDLVEATFFGPDGKAVLSQSRYHRRTYAYDEHGNQREWRVFGLDGKPAVDGHWECSAMVMTYDANGNRINSKRLDAEGQPTGGRLGVFSFQVVYDKQGRRIENAGLDAEGQPVLNPRTGIARTAVAHDERDNVIEFRYLGLDGKLALRRDWGVAKITRKFDLRGNLTELAYFGVDGEPVLLTGSGVAKYTFTHDERNQDIEVASYGVDGKLIAEKGSGVARTKFAYDDRGNRTEVSCFGPDDKPALDESGVFRTVLVFDDLGNVIAKSHAGIDDKPTLGKLGYAKASFTFDKDNRHAASAYFDLENRPVKTEVVVKASFDAAPFFSVDLKAGDLLLRYGGQPIACAEKFVHDLHAEEAPAAPRELLVRRGDKEVTVPIPYTLPPWFWQLETRAAR